MNTIRTIALASALAASVSLPAFAAPSVPPASDLQALPSVTLSAQAQVKVPTDEMVVLLRVEKEGANLGALNEAVLQELQDALTRAKSVSGVHAQLGSVHTRQTYTPQGQANGWHVQGNIMLDSKKLKELGDLTGKLSTRLQLGSVSFRLSAERRRALEQDLLKDAAQAFRGKAQAAAVALGYSDFVIKDVSISQASTGGELPMPVPMYAKAMSASVRTAAAVPEDAGETEVGVTLSGSVGLR
jgi:predicted secreted protein